MSEEYKGYKIVHDGTMGYKSIKAIGKGSVPIHLRGVYTKAVFAHNDIDKHISLKESNNGKAKSTK